MGYRRRRNIHRFSGINCCTCVLGIGFSVKYGQKKADASLEGCGETSNMGLALLRYILAGIGMEVEGFRRLGQRSLADGLGSLS